MSHDPHKSRYAAASVDDTLPTLAADPDTIRDTVGEDALK
jgi:hypothetical protein